MKNLTLLFILMIGISTIAQTTITKDKIEIRLKKSKPVDNVSLVGIRQLKVKSDELRKVMIKTKIKSLSHDKTKLSAFSLLDTINKIRYRLADYKGYAAIIGYPELIPYRKTELYRKNGKPLHNIPPFDESEKDYFTDYDQEAYTNFEIPVNFGSKKDPKLSVLYFGETEYKKFTAELYFTILEKYLHSSYVLYYKDEKVADIHF